MKSRKLFSTTQTKPLEKPPKPLRSNASKKKKRWKLLVFELCRKKPLTVRLKSTL
jgi:hypothetical protein